mgnify:CR=1 FL=1
MTRAQIQKHISNEKLRAALNTMHKAGSATSAKKRSLKQEQKKYRRDPNFGTGDYVLVGVPEQAKMTGRTLFQKWNGHISDYRHEGQLRFLRIIN